MFKVLRFCQQLCLGFREIHIIWTCPGTVPSETSSPIFYQTSQDIKQASKRHQKPKTTMWLSHLTSHLGSSADSFLLYFHFLIWLFGSSFMLSHMYNCIFYRDCPNICVINPYLLIRQSQRSFLYQVLNNLDNGNFFFKQARSYSRHHGRRN